MTKSELVAKLAESAGFTHSDAAKFLDAFVTTVKETTAGGDKVQLLGFGTFEVKKRAARTGVNPATGEKVSIAACKVPTFKPGKGWKDELNK